jgi:single-strand DNA-binding protein
MSTKIRIPDFNMVILIGRLTKDPWKGSTQKGQAVCTFDIAVNRNYRDANGEWQSEVVFVPVRVWREAAERCGARLKKGSPVLVTGRLRMSQWEDKEGKKRSTLEIEASRVQFMEVAVEDAESAVSSEPVQSEAAEGTGKQEEEIPF